MARYSFCSDLVSITVPDDWDIIALGTTVGGFTPPDNPDIRLIFQSASYEYPEIVKHRDVSGVICGHTGYPEPEGPVAPDTVFTWAGVGQSPSLLKRLILRQRAYRVQYFAIARILEPNLVRVLSGQLSGPVGGSDGAAFEALFPEVSALLEQAVFAPEQTPFDRIAGTPDLTLINQGNGIFIRLPKQWQYDLSEEDCCTGMSGGSLDAEVRVSAIGYAGDPDATAKDIAARLIEKVAEHLDDEMDPPAVQGSETDATSSAWLSGKEDVPPTRHYAAHRVVRRNGVTNIAYLVFSIPESQLETEAGAACLALIRRELANAVILLDDG
jgi:hypothetical protein